MQIILLYMTSLLNERLKNYITRTILTIVGSFTPNRYFELGTNPGRSGYQKTPYFCVSND